MDCEGLDAAHVRLGVVVPTGCASTAANHPDTFTTDDVPDAYFFDVGAATLILETPVDVNPVARSGVDTHR